MDLVFLSLQGLRISRYPGEDAFLGSHKVGDCTQHRFSSCKGFLLPPHPQVGTPVSRKRFARSSAGSLTHHKRRTRKIPLIGMEHRGESVHLSVVAAVFKTLQC